MGNDDLSAVFETVARGLDPDLRDVIDRAMRQGRRRRGRRRVTIAASAGVSVAVIATGVTLGARLGLRTALGASPAGLGKVAHHVRDHRVSPAHGPGMTTRQMLDALRPMLPPGKITYVYDPSERGSLEINFNDGRGAVDIMLWVEPPQLPSPLPSPTPTRSSSRLPSPSPSPTPTRSPSRLPSPSPTRSPSRLPSPSPTRSPSRLPSPSPSPTPTRAPSRLPSPSPTPSRLPGSASSRQMARIQRGQKLACPNPPRTDEGKRPAGALPISCVVRTLPDGSIERDEVTNADVAGFYRYLIYERRPDGIIVGIQVGNGTLGGTPHLTRVGWPYVDRARPPGSMALWTSIVESPAWHL